MIDIGLELERSRAVTARYSRRGVELGYPAGMMGALAKAPFDTLGDTLRGTQGIWMDMYRQPDKLLAALEVITRLTIKSAVRQANASGDMMAIFPLHKGADGWMSQPQFEKFYWPSLKKVVDALIAEGIMVTLFAEGSYNTRLDSVNEFPKGMVHWMFDQTDMARAKAVLGDKCSISGNVPASLLVAGTPEEVKEHCRRLIEVCAPGGGYILAPGNMDIASVKLENVLAMNAAAREYGVYKK
jgi:uroporphyrinogen-III decarboxylase